MQTGCALPVSATGLGPGVLREMSPDLSSWMSQSLKDSRKQVMSVTHASCDYRDGSHLSMVEIVGNLPWTLQGRHLEAQVGCFINSKMGKECLMSRSIHNIS